MFNHRLHAPERWKSYSDDGGMTFYGFAPVPKLPDPGCKGGIAAWPAGKALFFVNDATTHARDNITLRVSTDDGDTWSNGTLVSVPGGYTDVTMLDKSATNAKDMVVVVYESDTCTIRVAVLDPTTVH